MAIEDNLGTELGYTLHSIARAARRAERAAEKAERAAQTASDAARRAAEASERLTMATSGMPGLSASTDPAPLEGPACAEGAEAAGGALAPMSMARPQKGHFLEWFDEVKRRGRMYSTGEEIGNAVSHGVGAGLSIAGLVMLLIVAVSHGGGLRVPAALLFGVCLILEYTFSTLYHAIQSPHAKAIMRIFDHCAIYLLIAGSYAPFTLLTLHDEGGPTICAVVWAVAAVGIVLEVFGRQRQPKWVSALIYLAMGWAIVFKLPVLLALLPPTGTVLLVAGGICYTVGTAFYLMRRIPFMHMVWHLFVLAGSVCHFLAVLLFVL